MKSQITTALETVAGLVERVTYHNEESGFCVLKVHVKGRRDLTSVVGHVPTISAGEFIHASGVWFNDRQHGLQFKAVFLRATAPTTIEGIEKYLGSGIISGIGPTYAKKLLDCFKEDVFQIIEEQPNRLKEVPGIGSIRAEKITRGWEDQKVIRDIMVFLHSHGISTARAVRIYRTYGQEAITIITDNPYRLAKDIRGIGFVSADKIAEAVGIEKTSLIRMRAGIIYALTTALEEGHCGLPKVDLITRCKSLLDADEALVEEALILELTEGESVEDYVEGVSCIFLKGLMKAEQSIAERIDALMQGAPPWPLINSERALEWVEEQTKLSLSNSQKIAIKQSLSSKVLVITGGPGVGKTTLVNSILKILLAKQVRVLLGAPTGRAAKRLRESTGLDAKTLHRLLEINPMGGSFKRNQHAPLECDLLVIDEASMIDVPLMHALLRAVPPHAGVLLVGDVDQLPSVGPGQVLEDIINSDRVPVIRLTEIFRQDAESQIISSAHDINQGKMPKLDINSGAESQQDFYFIQVDEPEEAIKKIKALIAEHIPAKFKIDPISDIQVLCPMSRGLVGSRNLNVELQHILNPPTSNSIEKFGWIFTVGDKVMQTENNYDKEVYNGDLGRIVKIDREAGDLVALFDQREIVYTFSELDALALAYATTVHKSQGSEYRCVILPLMMQHYRMLSRRLIYTGITRGKNLVIVIGQQKALAIAVKHRGEQRRWSTLKKRLMAIN